MDETDEFGAVSVGISAAGAGGQRDNILNGSIAAILAVAQDHTKFCHGGREPEPVGGSTGLFYARTNPFAEQLAGQPGEPFTREVFRLLREGPRWMPARVGGNTTATEVSVMFVFR